MYTILNAMNEVEFDGIKTSKLIEINATEILSISLEKGKLLSKHTSPRDTHLLMLEGEISFHINDSSFIINKYQVFDFPKEEEHWVEAKENSKFLIIR